MFFDVHYCPFEDDLLGALAKDLCEALPEAANGDFSEAMVILPSSRACQTLGHVILESSRGNSVLLPQTVTLSQLMDELKIATGIFGSNIPADKTRPLILASLLKGELWLQGRPESAPGLADEFISFFDEVRLQGLTQQILEDGPLQDLMALVHSDAAQDVEKDVLRLRQVWQLYRQAIPRDSVDLLENLVQGIGRENQPWLKSAFGKKLIIVAGFANLDPLRVAVIRRMGSWSENSRLYLPSYSEPLSRFFASTWGQSSQLDPLAPARLIASLLLQENDGLPNEIPSEPPENINTLLENLAVLENDGGLLQPDGNIQLLPCHTSEDESQIVADAVVKILDGSRNEMKKTAVVTNDPVLAARITAQLRDAGVDTDQTLGSPLSSLPAGLLMRFLLRTVLTDFRADSLLEVLTHPFVKLPLPDGKNETWNLRLEKMLRRFEGGQLGASGLRKLACKQDEIAEEKFGSQKQGMADFMEIMLNAFAPLLVFQSRREATWAELLTAAASTWNRLCPEETLAENSEKSDLTSLARLWGLLNDNSALLPKVSLAGFASDVGRLLSAESVAPHRGKAKPVLICGTVEARLEKYDHLLLAGMAEGKFPAARQQPVFFNAPLRFKLGLPQWRQAAARDAALFLRLIYNAPKVQITWPTEEASRPVLPSPFVARLALALPQQTLPKKADKAPLWRRPGISDVDFQQAQKDFACETMDPVAWEEIRPLNRLSWSALRTWRDCPYRHLMARGFLMQKEDEVREEFSRRDYGSLVHQSLCNFMTPDKGGYEALLGGKPQEAGDALNECARREFLEQGDDTASRRLWLGNFQKCTQSLVEYELLRFKDWRPVLLEKRFELSLTRLLSWLENENSQLNLGLEIPEEPQTGEPVVLSGVIDRVDEEISNLDPDFRFAAIIDYKTGSLPKAKEITELKDLQIILYAVALEAGAVEDSQGKQWRVHQGFYYKIGEADSGAAGKIPLDCTVGEGRALLAEGALALAKMSMQAARPDQEFSLIPAEMAGEGEKNLPCRYCDFRGICRVEERIPEGQISLKLDKMVNRKDGAW